MTTLSSKTGTPIRRWFQFSSRRGSRRFGYSTAVATVLLAVLLGCTSGCGRSAIEVPDQLILYSIDGRSEKKNLPDGEMFHGYPVLGKLDIQEPDSRRKIMAALDDGIARSDGSMKKCFWPRHAIQTVRNGNSVDYVICFQCLQLVMSQASGATTIPTTKAPQAVFNEYLTQAGIPLAP